MTDHELQIIFAKYLDAFATKSPAEQEALLRSSVADDVVYANPGVEGSGLHNLLAHIDVFQKRFPGGRFRINWLRQQHGQVLSEWTQLDQDGAELVTGHSYARLNENGRIAHLAGFWKSGAV
jgi:SnoaL-like domain